MAKEMLNRENHFLEFFYVFSKIILLKGKMCKGLEEVIA